jgi:hypothetical protein
MGSKSFQPFFIIVKETGFVIIDEYRGGNMHGINQAQSFLYATLAQARLNLRCDVNKPPPVGKVEP